MGSPPEVSVIVPVRNAEATLRPLLDALIERQTCAPERFEVIVADDASTDGTAELVAATPGARLVRSSRQGGSYSARNLALTEARASVLAFTDGDCLPAPDWIERGLAAFTSGTADLIAGRIEMALGQRPTAATLIDYGRHLNQERAVADGFGATANLWARREVFDRVGPFNDRLISGGDTEFGHRAAAAGFQIRYAPEVVVGHPPRATARQLARKAYRLGYGAAQQRYHAAGRLRDRPHICLRPGAYIPHRSIYGLERIREAGVPIPMSRRLALHAVTYFCVQLPAVAGNARGTLDERSGRRSRSEQVAASTPAA